MDAARIYKLEEQFTTRDTQFGSNLGVNVVCEEGDILLNGGCLLVQPELFAVELAASIPVQMGSPMGDAWICRMNKQGNGEVTIIGRITCLSQD